MIGAEKANHSIGALCRALKVSKSGYHGWRRKTPSARAKADAALVETIGRVHRDSRGTYGAPRVHAELLSLGVRCSRKRVARLIRASGLLGCGGRRRARTTAGAKPNARRPRPTWRCAISSRKHPTNCGLRT